MDTLFHDVRYATRKLLRTPSFTTIAVLTLALAIGATTAVYSVVDAVLLRPLPFTSPSQLVRVGSINRDGAVDAAAPLDLADFRDQSVTLAGLVPMRELNSVSFEREGSETLRLPWARVGTGFFPLLGVQPAIGRGFAAGEDSIGAPKVVILGNATWRTFFNADREILGQSIRLGHSAYTVIGVAPPSMTFPGNPAFWVPNVYEPWELTPQSRGVHEIFALGRLKPGATVDRARADLGTIARRLAKQYPATNEGYSASVESLTGHLVNAARVPLLAMLGAVTLVLLIACVNVANLLLVRATGRRTEIAVRTALGAARRRVVRQLIVESTILSLAGFAVGALFAVWAVDAVVAFGPRGLPRLQEIAINGRVLLVTASVTLTTGVLFGLVPALYASRPDTSTMLRDGARGATAASMTRTRSALVVVEMALAVVLLIGAGLLIRSVERLTGVDPGFRPDQAIAFDVGLNSVTYPRDHEVNAFVATLTERLRHLPGIEDVGVADADPFETLRTFNITTSFTVAGQASRQPGEQVMTELMPVSSGYFTALGIPLIKGRPFTEAEDRRDVPPVVVVNETFARRYFGGQNPIGQRIELGISHDTGATGAGVARSGGEIVGVVGDVRETSLAEAVAPRTYLPFSTLPFRVAVVVRSAANPGLTMRAIRAAVREIDPSVPVFDLHTLDGALSASVAQPRFYALLLGSFATIALVLAALGIYGVISYAVSQRTNEIGIRIALGAAPGHVLRIVLGGGLSLSVAGAAIGLLGAIALTRTISTLLFEIPPIDPLTYASAGAGLLAVATLACWIPARRAARVDPVIAMRAQ